MIRIANPAPAKIRAIANFAGLDGSCPRAPSHSQSQAKTGARIQRKSEFSDWNQLLGNGRPRSTLLVLRSANRFSVEPACSNTDQKMPAAKNSAAMAYSRRRSSGVQPPDPKSQAKKPSVRKRSK